MVAEEPVDAVDELKIDEIKLEEEKDLVCSFNLSLLQVIREYQNLHGLKHDDYQRYRQYCTRRLQRLYKGLKFLHGAKKFSNKKITPEMYCKDPRYLMITLIRAERAWAYALDLKQFANTEPRKQSHLVAKLKKAVIYAEELEGTCVSLKCDPSTQLEAKAYTHYMRGMLNFEKANWQRCLVAFTSAQKIYSKLADAVEEGGMYREKCEEMTPKVQYCLYNIQSSRGTIDTNEVGEELLAELDGIIASRASAPTQAVYELKWEGKTVSITHDEIKIQLAQLQDNIKLAKDVGTNQEKGLELLDEVVGGCRDVVQIVRRAEKLESADTLTDYFNYLRITSTIERFLLMAQQVSDKLKGVVETRPGTKMARPEDLVRLYDIILQNYADLKGIVSIEKEGEFYRSIDVNTMFYRALRCFYIAECHLGQSNWLNAIVLYDKCNEHVSETLASTSDKEMIGELNALSKQIYSQRCSAHASAFLHSQLQEEEMTDISPADKNRILSNCLDQFRLVSSAADLPTIATLPPDFQTTPCKPTFFDISLNQIEFPDLSTRVEKEGALSGLSRWIWGR